MNKPQYAVADSAGLRRFPFLALYVIDVARPTYSYEQRSLESGGNRGKICETPYWMQVLNDRTL
jgi:hypothetical protein